MVMVIRRIDGGALPKSLEGVSPRLEVSGYQWEYFIIAMGKSKQDEDLARRLAVHLTVDKMDFFTLDNGVDAGSTVWVSYSEVGEHVKSVRSFASMDSRLAFLDGEGETS